MAIREIEVGESITTKEEAVVEDPFACCHNCNKEGSNSLVAAKKQIWLCPACLELYNDLRPKHSEEVLLDQMEETTLEE